MNYLVLKVCDPGDVVGLVVDDDVCSVSGVPNRLCCYLGSAEALTPVFLVLREFHVRILHYLSYSVRTGSWDRVLVEEAVGLQPCAAVPGEIVESVHLAPDLVGVEWVAVRELHILSQVEGVGLTIRRHSPAGREPGQILNGTLLIFGRLVYAHEWLIDRVGQPVRPRQFREGVQLIQVVDGPHPLVYGQGIDALRRWNVRRKEARCSSARLDGSCA